MNTVCSLSSNLFMLSIVETIMNPLIGRALIHIYRIIFQMKRYVNIMKRFPQKMR